MGIDVYGWIEIWDELDKIWFGAIKVNPQLMNSDRNPLLMAHLFAPHTIDDKNAIAANRGLPPNVSVEAKSEASTGFGQSWISWNEIQRIEWQEHKVHFGSSEILEKYRQIDEQTKVVLTGGWELIFELMRTLALFRGSDHVRLVVWFG